MNQNLNLNVTDRAAMAGQGGEKLKINHSYVHEEYDIVKNYYHNINDSPSQWQTWGSQEECLTSSEFKLENTDCLLFLNLKSYLKQIIW